MEQQITISKNIIYYFYNELSNSNNSFEIKDYQKCYQYLKQNYFISDKEKIILKEFQNEIETIEDEQKILEFKRYFGNLLLDRVRVVENYTIENSNLKYYKLCNASDDKIYFDPEFKTDELNLLKLSLYNAGLNDVELNTLDSFLNPDPDSKLNHKRIINFEKGRKYELDEILKPFVRDTKNLLIVDNFIANKNAQFHFSKILKKVNRETIIKLVTLSKQDYLNRRTDKEFAENIYNELLSLIKNYNIELIENKSSGHLERYIVTDKFEISLPGGFDQFKKDGTPVFKSENTILKMVIADAVTEI